MRKTNDDHVTRFSEEHSKSKEKSVLIKKNVHPNAAKELVKYIYDNGIKIGCIVAQGPTERDINWSLCAKEDHFSKKEGKEIARSRIGIPYPVTFFKEMLHTKNIDEKYKAIVNEFVKWPNKKHVEAITPQRRHRFRLLKEELESMQDRAIRYFK